MTPKLSRCSWKFITMAFIALHGLTPGQPSQVYLLWGLLLPCTPVVLSQSTGVLCMPVLLPKTSLPT